MHYMYSHEFPIIAGVAHVIIPLVEYPSNCELEQPIIAKRHVDVGTTFHQNPISS